MLAFKYIPLDGAPTPCWRSTWAFPAGGGGIGGLPPHSEHTLSPSAQPDYRRALIRLQSG